MDLKADLIELEEVEVAEAIEGKLIKPGALEKLMEESRNIKDGSLILFKEKRFAKAKREKKDKLQKNIHTAVKLIRKYAKEELSIDRELTLNEVIALAPTVARAEWSNILLLSIGSVVHMSYIFGAIYLSSPMLLFGGLCLNSIIGYLGLKDIYNHEDWPGFIFLGVFWNLSPQFFLIFRITNDPWWTPKYLDLKDKPEEYKSFVREAFKNIQEFPQEW